MSRLFYPIFCARSGSDENDGLSWERAKRWVPPDAPDGAIIHAQVGTWRTGDFVRSWNERDVEIQMLIEEPPG